MISYRREDSWAFAGRVYDRLTGEYGRERVFMDVDSIDPGDDFVAALEKIVAGCDALVAVIGKDWVTVRDAQGRRRLENPKDWVHVEIATALARGIPVIPLLMPNVRMPSESELPGPLKKLSRRNAIFTSETDFDAALDQLMSGLSKTVRGGRGRKLAFAYSGAAALVLILVAGGYGLSKYRESGARAEAVEERLKVARLQEQASDYAGAWKLAEEAVALSPGSSEALQTRMEVGMHWLREFGSVQSNAEVLDRILAVLYQGAVSAKGQRAADLHAHIGWGNYLKRREGAHQLEVISQFEKAVAEDSQNPFAHAMWGLCIVVAEADLERGQAHFREALKSGRERTYVRRLQLAALRSMDGVPPATETIRVANEIRTNGEELSLDVRYETFRHVYSMINREILRDFENILPPAEHLATFRWLLEGREVAESAVQISFYARVLEQAGEPAEAFLYYVAALPSTLSTEAEKGIARCRLKAPREVLDQALDKALQEGDLRLRKQIVRGLPGLLHLREDPWTPDAIVPGLVEFLSGSQALWSDASDALASIGEPAVPSLTNLMETASSDVTRRAVKVLGDIGTEASAAVPGLVALLEKGSAEMRLDAIRALAEIGEGARLAVPALIRCVEDTRNDEIRQVAAYGLGQVGPAAAGAVPALIQLLKDTRNDEAGERGAVAAEALGSIGPGAAAAVPALVEALNDGRFRVPARAFDALANIGAEARSAIPEMIAALKRAEAEYQPGRAEALALIAKDLAHKGETQAIPLIRLIVRAFQEEDLDSSVIAPVQAALDRLLKEKPTPDAD
jgi:hypothetical protein